MPEDYCRAAYEKGFAALGFSAHAPLPVNSGLKTDWHMSGQRLDEYLAAVRAAAGKWRGKLPVFAGLEADFISGVAKPSDWDFDASALDFLIGSVHYASATRCVDSPPEEFALLVNEDFSGDTFAMVDTYWSNVERMIESGGFDILGHADLVKKNNRGGLYFSENDTRYTKWLPRIAAAAAAAGIVAEVNTGALNRGYTDEPYPSLALLTLFCKAGVPVTINADAHRPEHLGGFYEDAHRLCLEAGYREFRLFQGRRDGKAQWGKEKF
ncbi:histidinol-phosphatase [Spirochaetia bacterium]|nr:histidinol-phosphatase [Spirochaetia bacterium]